MRYVKQFLVMIITLLFTITAAHSTEVRKLSKIICMPEFNYLEITSVAIDRSHFNDKLWKKYNQFSQNTCRIKGQTITIKEISPPASLNGECSADDHTSLSLWRDNKRLIKLPFFHSTCRTERIHILIFDGETIAYCSGIGGTECKRKNISK